MVRLTLAKAISFLLFAEAAEAVVEVEIDGFEVAVLRGTFCKKMKHFRPGGIHKLSC